MAAIDEEELITRVIAARTDLGVSTPAECLKVLEADFEGLTLSQCKKACSKATKRTGPAPTAAKAEPEEAAAPAKPSKRQEKEAAKAAQAQAAEVKAAESEMMEAQRKLRVAKNGEPPNAQIQIAGTIEDFIQKATQRAIAGLLSDDEQPFLKERIEADITALEWVKLAQAQGALSLTEDVVALGVEVQLQRLKEARGAADVSAARACFQLEAKPRATAEGDANAALDARVKAAAARPTGEAIDEMD